MLRDLAKYLGVTELLEEGRHVYNSALWYILKGSVSILNRQDRQSKLVH